MGSGIGVPGILHRRYGKKHKRSLTLLGGWIGLRGRYLRGQLVKVVKLAGLQKINNQQKFATRTSTQGGAKCAKGVFE